MKENETKKSCYWCKHYIPCEDICEMCMEPLWGNDNPCDDYDDGSQEQEQER